MGTIASVLQWTCTNCNLINPTESLKCLNCGNVRHILAEETDSIHIIDNDGDSIRKAKQYLQSGSRQMSNGQSNNDDGITNKLHKTLPGYVEINTSGYRTIAFYEIF